MHTAVNFGVKCELVLCWVAVCELVQALALQSYLHFYEKLDGDDQFEKVKLQSSVRESWNHTCLRGL